MVDFEIDKYFFDLHVFTKHDTFFMKTATNEIQEETLLISVFSFSNPHLSN